MSTYKRWLYMLASSFALLIAVSGFSQKTKDQVAAKCADFTATITNGSVINLCTGASLNLTSIPSNSSYTYQWQVQPLTGGPFTNVSGATAANYSTSDLGAYRVIITTGSCKDTSGITSVIRITVVGGTITPATTRALCPGEVGGLISGDTVPGLASGIVKFQWERNEGSSWTAITGATDISYLVPNLFRQTMFRRVAYDNCGNRVSSNEVTLRIAGVVSGGTIAPKTQTVNQATTPQPLNSVTPAGGGSGTISYQWQSSKYERGPYLDIAGATGLNYAPGNLQQNTYFRRMAKDSRCGNAAYSDTAIVIVTDAILDAGFFTTGSSCVFPGSSASVLETGFPPTGGTGPYQTQWQQSFDNITWTDIPGATTTNYQPSNLTQSTWFRKKVTDAVGAVAYSNSVFITLITSTLTGGTIASTASVACLGSNPAQIRSTGSPTGFAEKLSFQWQYSNASTGGNWVNIQGQVRENLIPDPITERTKFRRLAVDACGPNSRSAASNEVEIDIRPALNPGDIAPTAQVIRPGQVPQQITNVVAPSGGTNSYTIYWDSAALAVGPWTSLTNRTALSYQPSALQQSAYYRRVVMDNNCLATKTTYVVEVFVNTAPGVVGGTLTGSGCVFPGNRPSRISGSLPTGGTAPYTYSWERRTGITGNWTVINGASGQNYLPPVITQTTQFRRKATDVYGDFDYTPPFTISVTATPLNAGTIAATSAGSVCSGTRPGIIQSITPYSGFGENPRYQWQIQLGTTTWTDITGANSETYQPGVINQRTSFRRVASDQCGGVTRFAFSNEVTFEIAVNTRLLAGLVDGPFITCTGTAPGTINSVLDACGPGTVSYQWQVSTGSGYTNITGATSANYTPGALTANSIFRRRVTDGCGNLGVSNNVEIYVYPAIEPGVIGAATQTICANQTPAAISLTTNCHYTDGVVTYQWQTSSSNAGPWTDISGATTNSYAPGALSASTFYRLKVMSTTCSAEAFTNVASVIVSANCRPLGNRAAPTVDNITDNKVFPNPLTGNTLQVQLESAGKASVRMVSAEGAVVPVSISQNGLSQMKVSFQQKPAKGVYLMTVLEGTKSWTKKVVVQ